jgi:cardiolipin synthase
MSSTRSRPRMLLTVLLTAVITFLVVMVALNFARPEKKLGWKIEHRYALSDPQFRREMSVMLGPSITSGNTVTALQNGVEIFPAMIDAIHAARTSITFETYIYWSGEIGETFTAALIERAKAGIPVSVIIDWVGSAKMDRALLERMEEAGVRVRRYRPLKWYNLRRLNHRTHRKLLIVDGRIGFTGGVGIADQWQGNAEDPDHWRETHFRIEGPVVAQFQAAFNDNWIKTTGELLNDSSYFPPLESTGALDSHLFIASPAGGSESMHLMYLLAVAASMKTIDLAAAYFVPDELAVQAFEAARKRGVRVRVLLPGPHIDTETVRIASKATWGRLLRAGVEIYVYQPTMIHTKLLIVDNELVSVGSTNFDPRSFRLNDEANLNVYDTTFAGQMTEVFEKDLKPTTRYTLEMWTRRPMKEKLVEKLLRPFRSQL